DDRGCDILSYDLELRLDPSAGTVTGTVAVGFAALADGLDTLRLDLVGALTVTGITRGGGCAPFLHTGAALHVLLAPPAAVGRPDTVVVSWQGRPPRHGPFRAGLMFRSHDAGTPLDPGDDVPVIANVSQPWSAHSWWPCKDLPADKALVSLAVTVPDTLSVMANGTLLGTDPADPGWRRWAWREAYPIAPYLVSVAISDYVGWDEDCRPAVGGPVPLEFRIFPQDSAKAAFDLAPTCAMVEMMADLAGPWPFPGEKYAQAEIIWAGAMEHQTATSFARFLLTGTGYFENFVIHELAHQWFGDSLTPATWADLWLNEGFARYCEALWLERSRGPEAYRQYLQQIGPLAHPDLFTEQGLLGDPDPILPNLMVYDKGAWLLHSLRLLLGDRDFFAFLADYATRPELVHGTVTTADAVAAAERASGRDLGAFFTAWLQTTAVAEIAAEVVVTPRRGGTALVAVTLEQRQDPVFPVAVPVVVTTAQGTSREIVRLEDRRGTFSFTVPAPVAAVAIDPDSLVLMRRAAPAPPPLAVAGPAPNPVPAAGAVFVVTPAADGPVTVRVYDARGRLLGSHDLGSLPSGQPFQWRWLPAAADGRPLPSGVAWLEFRSAGGRAVRQAVVLH
ncbi:MAG: hypothetical protein IH621_11470, partial [Krumholzibacteria bacterium]|nr:hypothetical protein [Candidatus Krumholzibacteria bacterium]